MRAVTALPLGSTAVRGHAAMVNLIGDVPDPKRLLEVESSHVHLYGKEPRPGRKVGHVTVRADDRQKLLDDAMRIRAIVEGT
jgi:5-(carboxyamino)imidazole ribonucleotide synthase